MQAELRELRARVRTLEAEKRRPTLEGHGARVQAIAAEAAALQPLKEAAAATAQLDWIRAKVAQHAARVAAAAEARGKPIQLLRVQPTIPCVCAAEGGGASLAALREQLESIARTQPPLLPSVGISIPGSWRGALDLIRALRDGRRRG